VPGQPRAVALLRAATADPVHAYLFLGPPGSGKDEAARVFAGELLAATASGDEDADRHRALAAADGHPDVTVVRREGASIRVEQAAEIIRLASLKPIEGDRKVLVLDEFHLVVEATAGKLLKTIEEPPAGTIFVVLADELTEELVTIASRCVPVPFSALTAEVVADVLAAEGVAAAQAARIGVASHGDIGRARLLAADEQFARRLEAWRRVPERLDGTGSAVVTVVSELRAAIDEASAALAAQHEIETAELNERIERYGMRGSGARLLEESHNRQKRRLRTDEVRMGLGELAHVYRDSLVERATEDGVAATSDSGADRASDALRAIHDAVEALIRNPNEELLLQALMVRLSGSPAHR
jgi:DNA polymerase-3 subunit delta'